MHTYSNTVSVVMKLPPLKTHFLKRQYPPVFTIQSCCKCPRNKYLSNIYLFLNPLHFQNLMPTSFIQWCINQTALWLPQAFIHSKKCKQSSPFSSAKCAPPKNKSSFGKCVMMLVLKPCSCHWKLVQPLWRGSDGVFQGPYYC